MRYDDDKWKANSCQSFKKVCLYFFSEKWKNFKVCFNNYAFTKEMKYFTNYKTGEIIYGDESLIKDYVTLSQDPISNLPARFTICSSLYLGRISTTPNAFQLYNENGKGWFNFGIQMKDKLRNNVRTERVQMYYQTGKELFLAAKRSSSSTRPSVIIKA